MMKDEVLIEPPLYFVEENLQIWSTQFHPTQNVLAATLINGHVQILKYSSNQVIPIATITDCHRLSARHCSFNPEGSLLVTCGQDKRLGYIDSNAQIVSLKKKAHESPINRVNFASDHIVLSGDDEGVVKVWDIRTNECVFEAHDQSEAITQMYFDPVNLQMITSCLDGTLAVYDLKQGNDSSDKLLARTDSADEELHGLVMLKDGKYIACPSTEGSVLVYKRECLETYVDRIKGQAGSVEAILKINDNTILTGSQDGFVQAVSVKPNKLLEVIGQHEEDEHFPVLSLSLSNCGNIVASTSHDNSIKFYDISALVRARAAVSGNDEELGEAVEVEEGADDQSDIFEDEDSEDSEQSDESMEKKKKKKKTKINLKNRQSQMRKNNQRKFFQGL